MTTITTTCAGCGRALTVPDRYAGRELKCPGCGLPFRVEVAPPEPASLAPQAAPAPAPPAAAPEAPEAFAAPPPSPFGEVPQTPPEPEPAGAVEGGAVYWRVRRVGVLSTAAVSALVYSVFGLLVGVAVAIGSTFLRAAPVPLLRGPLAGALAVVALPLIYGALGFVLGLLLALLYNLAGRLTGGIRVLLE